MPRRFYFLITLATLAGAFLRLWQLTKVPPGLHYDLAATALLGNEVAFDGYRPVFISAYTGHEALFYYWLALWFRLIGSSVFALRLAAALLGILTVPATFFAVREILRFEETSLIVAAFGATFLSFAFFHVTFSRFGFRVITEPLVQSLALGFLFRGLNRAPHRISDVRLAQGDSDFRPGPWILGRWRRIGDFVLAGLLTGLAAYTYLAARFFPIPLAIFWLALLLVSLRQSRVTYHASRLTHLISHLTLFGLSALLAFAPLGLYFLRHPEDFLNRARQIVPRAGESRLLLEGFRRAAGMIFINGEPYDRFNLPGRPLFGSVLGFFFVIGLLITLRNLVRPSSPTRGSPTELLLLTWLPIMLLPTALAVHDVFPSNVRAFGLIPLLFVFPSRGLAASYRWLQSIWPGPMIPHPYPLTIVCLVALAAGTVAAFQDYFGDWANLPNQRRNNDADMTGIAGYLNTQDLTSTAVFVSSIHYRHPTLAYLARDFESIGWLTGGASLAIPEKQGALYVFARSAPPPEEWIAGWEANLATAPLDPDNTPAFRAFRFAPGERPPLPEVQPLASSGNFQNAVTLTGYRVLTGTDEVRVDLRWRVENLIEAGDMLPYVRLYDAWGAAWSQSGGFTYPSEQWQPGDTLLTRLTLPLPPGLPPGAYTLKAGLYSAGTQTSLPRLDAQGGYAGERAALTEIRLEGGPPVDVEDFRAIHSPSTPARTSGLDGDLALLGYHLDRAAARQGERMNLTLFWHARRPVAASELTIRLGDRPIFTGHPVRNTFPFSQWSQGQVLMDRYTLKVPVEHPPGPSELGLSVPGYGSGVLVSLEVLRVERSFAVPEASSSEVHDFNHEIALYSYRLEPGRPVTATLVWQSLHATDADYTAFVHVLDGAGTVVAQADTPPLGGAYPTSLWVPGEFVRDAYRFDLPTGSYSIEVGLYLSESGERLPVFDAAGNEMGDAVSLPMFQLP